LPAITVRIASTVKEQGRHSRTTCKI